MTLASVKADDKTQADIADVMETLRGNLEKIVQHGKRADLIVKNMLLHSREGSGEHRPVDVNALVEESLNLAYHGARAEKEGFNITLETLLRPGGGRSRPVPAGGHAGPAQFDFKRLLCGNQTQGRGGQQGLRARLVAATKNLGDGVEIKIRDNGTGIPAEVKAKMFNPFFTTKPAGEGTGLGLSISHDIIVKQHGGSIAVDTEPGKFTEFRIVLPRSGGIHCKNVQCQAGGTSVSLLIIVVDDEPDVEDLFRQQFRRDLRAGRFAMEFAQSAPAALQRITDAANASLILILSASTRRQLAALNFLPRARRHGPTCPSS